MNILQLILDLNRLDEVVNFSDKSKIILLVDGIRHELSFISVDAGTKDILLHSYSNACIFPQGQPFTLWHEPNDRLYFIESCYSYERIRMAYPDEVVYQREDGVCIRFDYFPF